MAKKVIKQKATPVAAEVLDVKNRHTFGDVINEISASNVKDAISGAAEARKFKALRLFTGILDIDLFCGLMFGKTIQIVAQPHYGKSLLTLIIAAAAQRTCRRCYTPIITWVDDYSVFLANRKDWEAKTKEWQTTGVCPFPSKRTCGCGNNDKCRVLLVDAEDSFDPYWANLWGCDVGDFSAYDAVNYEQGDKPNVWVGVKISKDESLIVCRPPSINVSQDVILPMIANGAADLVIYDSVAAAAVDEDLEGTHKLGSRARALAYLLPKILSNKMLATTAFGSRAMLVLINQFRQGPTQNPKQDPNREAGGLALKYTVDQTIKLTGSKANVPIKEGWKVRTVTKDIEFRVTKAKAGGTSDGAEGNMRLYLDDYKYSDSVSFKAGTSNEAQKLLEAIRELNNDAVFKEEKGKAYWVLGRPFKRVAEIVAFLQRPDIGYLLRFILFASYLPVSGRLHLRDNNYTYTPFKTEPALDVIKQFQQKTGESLRALRETGADVGSANAKQSTKASESGDGSDDSNSEQE